MKPKWISTPYIIWMLLFTVVPLFLVLYYSLTMETADGIRFTFEHFQRIADPIYLAVLIRSIVLAGISTIACLLIGYPMAYILASKEFSKKNTLIMLIVIPMWMNFLLRTYAWMTLLENKGIINSILAQLGFGHVKLLYTNSAVVFGMVYNFLPFMVLPIYSVLMKIDNSVIEAAQDLGADTPTIFRRVIFPLSLPGVVSGITMVFLPAVTTFVISRLLGGSKSALIGNLIEDQFILLHDWNFGSVLSIVMMCIILVSMAVMSLFNKDGEGGALL